MFMKNCQRILKYSRIQICPCRLVGTGINAPRKLPVSRPISISNYLLLVCPATCLGLAYWQIQRKKWKEDLIEMVQARTKMEPVELPQDLKELENMELYPVKVKGHFDYTNEVYIGPKTDIRDFETRKEDPKVHRLLEGKTSGAHVITPFKLADRDLTILVNRGWYEDAKVFSEAARQKGRVYGEQEIVGYIRHDQDTRSILLVFVEVDKSEVKKGAEIYLVRKIDTLAKRCNTAPVYIDSKMVRQSTDEPKPIELNPEFRNDHLMYTITWLGLAFFTTMLWVNKNRAPTRTVGVSSFIAQQRTPRR